MISRPSLSDSAALQARFGVRVAAALSGQAAQLPHDVLERLRVSRDQAVVRARHMRLATAPPAVEVTGWQGSAAVLGGDARWWQRAAAMLPLVVLVVGLVLINEWTTREQVLAAAEIDAQLLADDLPPSAYSDPGFAEFLRSSPP
jgi:hypothetical protein